MAMGERVGALLRDPMIVFQRLKQMWVASSHTDSFRHVFTRELLHLCRRHAIRRLEIRPDVFRPTRAIMREGSFCDEPVDAPAEMKPATLEERRSNLSGLALSGGGIRSASFACGLLEALAETKYLESFDYLSTVSGGGYAGTALTWSLHQQPHNAIGANDFATMTVDDVQNPRDLRKGMKITQIPLLKHIRRRANYLAPNDSISLMVGLLNTIRMSAMSVLIYAILIVAISIPLVWLYDRAAAGACDASGDPFSVLRNNKNYLLTVIAGWPWQARIAWLLNGFLDLSELAANTFAPASYSEETWPRQCLARFSTLIASALIAIYIIYFLSLLLLYAFIHSFELSYKNRVSALLNFTMITTVIFGMLVLSLIPIILGYSDNIFTNDSLQIGSLSALIGSAVSFGLSMVQRFGERVRVLLIRLAALLISVLALTLVLFVSFSITRNIPGTFFAERFGPHVIWNSAIAAGTGLAVAVLVYGLITKAPMSQQWRSRGLFLFAVASAISMGGFIFLCVALINAHIPNEVMLVFIRLDGVMFGVVVLFNFLNPNSISSHRFYRDRLMETFMPSQSGRNYKPADNAELYRMFDAHLSFEDGGKTETVEPYRGPYHIVNTNVILVRSNNPEYYQRGGDSFILSPLYCGSQATGWIATKDHAIRFFKKDTGLTLPTAMAISGAAANPNTAGGEDTTMRRWSISFLMTLLNIRLGLWQPNPRLGKGSFRRDTPQPSFVAPGLGSLLSNYYDETKDYVELSDGGHFDNTGLYELLRRRVRIIVLSDGSCDPDYSLDDLARVLMLAQTDFGVTVDFQGLDVSQSQDIWEKLDVSPEQPNTYRGKGYPWVADGVRAKVLRDGYAVATITYPGTAPGAKRMLGYLVYVKPALVEYAPVKTLSYALNNAEFPHQSTAEQFFSEYRFEAYRSLGHTIGRKMITEVFV